MLQDALPLLDLVVEMPGQGAQQRELLLLDPRLQIGMQRIELGKGLNDQQQYRDGGSTESQFELEAERRHGS